VVYPLGVVVHKDERYIRSAADAWNGRISGVEAALRKAYRRVASRCGGVCSPGSPDTTIPTVCSG
jgi:hypothetical protein